MKVGRRPYAVALSGNKAFVTDQYAETISVIDLSDLKVTKKIDVGAYPEGIAADASGDYVYVACWEENTLERINTRTLNVENQVEVPDGPRAFGDFLR